MTSPSAPRTNPWLALAVLCIANFLILLDTTIINTAAPTIMSTLDAGIDEVLWVLNGYLLAFASLLILFGRLGDLFGPRRMFALGLLLFTVASALAAVSQTAEQLVAARVVQGVGAAALIPQALVLIAAIFPADRRGAAFGIFTSVAGIASVSGPTLGGFLVTELGWQSIFYLNVPVALVGLVLAFRFVPDLRPGRQHRLDLVGVLLATLALVGLVYGLVEGERYDWGTIAGPVTIPAILIASGVLMLLFLLWERRRPEPLIPLGLFRSRNFSIAAAIVFILSFSLYGLLLVFVVETQSLLGMSPLMSGVTALPMTLTLTFLAPVAGRLADRIGGKILLVSGLTVYALGVFAVAFVPNTSSTAATFILPLSVVGIGMGVAFAPATTEAMRPVVPQMVGAASGMLNTARQVGGALGAAVIGAVLQNRLVDSLNQATQARAGELPEAAREPFLNSFEQASANGLQLGIGQSGGVVAPEDLPPDVTDQFNQLVQDAFSEGFISASRPTLTVVAITILFAGFLAVFMSRPKHAPDASAAAAQPRLDDTAQVQGLSKS